MPPLPGPGWLLASHRVLLNSPLLLSCRPAVYLCKYFTIAEGWCYMSSCYTGYGGLLSGGPVSTLGSTQFNAFDSWSSWTTQMKARRMQQAPALLFSCQRLCCIGAPHMTRQAHSLNCRQRLSC